MLDHYASWFDLTPTEARLAAMLAQGHSLEDYARNRAVTVNAGRFLLKNIFAKTGVSRQAELVALLRDAPDGWIAAPDQPRLSD
jgi:DNA-binding CsgD family transcriptional regulator